MKLCLNNKLHLVTEINLSSAIKSIFNFHFPKNRGGTKYQ